MLEDVSQQRGISTDLAKQECTCLECGGMWPMLGFPWHAASCSKFAPMITNPGSKPTNPKDAMAIDKAPLHLVPASFKALTALALAEGAMKYGAHNWRAAGIRASVYVAALQRHLDKWWNGEMADPATGVPHLANACACLAILIDAEMSGKCVDDRPPAQAELSNYIDKRVPGGIEKLREVFGHMTPHHWTISDELPDA